MQHGHLFTQFALATHSHPMPAAYHKTSRLQPRHWLNISREVSILTTLRELKCGIRGSLRLLHLLQQLLHAALAQPQASHPRLSASRASNHTSPAVLHIIAG
jgi:hypothetical protein